MVMYVVFLSQTFSRTGKCCDPKVFMRNNKKLVSEAKMKFFEQFLVICKPFPPLNYENLAIFPEYGFKETTPTSFSQTI